MLKFFCQSLVANHELQQSCVSLFFNLQEIQAGTKCTDIELHKVSTFDHELVGRKKRSAQDVF